MSQSTLVIGASAPAVRNVDELGLPLDKWLIVIEVFRTNVETGYDARMILAILKQEFALADLNFDLQDVDRILRVRMNESICSEQVMATLRNLGFSAEVLPDTTPSINDFFDGDLTGDSLATEVLTVFYPTNESPD